MVENENEHSPYDIVKDTLKSIRIWLDKIAELSVGIYGGDRIEPNEIIIVKSKMVKQLIMISSALLEENDLKEIEEFYYGIEIKKGSIKMNVVWNRNAPIYTIDVDYKLDECVQGIEKGLNKYFKPTIKEGSPY